MAIGWATSTLAAWAAVLAAVVVVVPVGWLARRRAGRAEPGPGAASRGPRLGLADAVLAAVLAGVVVLVQLVVAVRAGASSWQLMAVVFDDVAIALPLVGAAVVVSHVASRRWATPSATGPVLVLAGVALLAAPVGWYVVHVAPFDLRLETVAQPLPPERAGDDTIRIGVLSDIQTTNIGAHERAAARLVADQQPDLVVVAGDLFQGSPAQLDANREALRSLLVDLDAPSGVFVVEGDVDGPNDLPGLVEGTGATLLRDEIVTIAVGDRTVRLAGMRLEPHPRSDGVIDAVAARPPEEVGIVLAHRPDWALRAPPGSVDLVIAGHTHGGQIQLPFLGPLTVASRVPRSVGAGGLHQVDGNPLYVTPGVGREQQGAPQIRFLADPSVAIIELG